MEDRKLMSFFKENPDLFDQQPPQRAWNKLEARLQAQKRNSKRVRLKWLRTFSIAASLTGLFIISVWLVSRFERADMAFGQAVAMKLIEPSLDDAPEAARLQYPNPILEGEEGRTLLTKEEAQLLQRKLVFKGSK